MFEPVVATLITSMARTVTGARSPVAGLRARCRCNASTSPTTAATATLCCCGPSLPQNLREFTRPVAGSDYWNKRAASLHHQPRV